MSVAPVYLSGFVTDVVVVCLRALYGAGARCAAVFQCSGPMSRVSDCDTTASRRVSCCTKFARPDDLNDNSISLQRLKAPRNFPKLLSILVSVFPSVVCPMPLAQNGAF